MRTTQTNEYIASYTRLSRIVSWMINICIILFVCCVRRQSLSEMWSDAFYQTLANANHPSSIVIFNIYSVTLWVFDVDCIFFFFSVFLNINNSIENTLNALWRLFVYITRIYTESITANIHTHRQTDRRKHGQAQYNWSTFCSCVVTAKVHHFGL